jgi:hypothetical protein
MPTISGINFKNVVATGVALDDTYDLVPFDAAGKAEQFLIVEVDSTLGVVTLNLPEIVNFGGVYNTAIKIVATTGATNDVDIVCAGSDLIGSNATLTLSGDGTNAILTPVSTLAWSAIVSL